MLFGKFQMLKKNNRRNELFYFHRNPGYHDDHLVGTGGDVLVQAALEVGETALDGVLRHFAHADLVGYEDKNGLLRGETVEFGGQFG